MAIFRFLDSSVVRPFLERSASKMAGRRSFSQMADNKAAAAASGDSQVAGSKGDTSNFPYAGGIVIGSGLAGIKVLFFDDGFCFGKWRKQKADVALREAMEADIEKELRCMYGLN